VSIDDLAWQKAEDVLIRIEPALAFWRDTDFVGITIGEEEKPVSFNLLDVTLNYANEIPCDKRIIHNMQSALWDELLVRYMSSNHIRSQILSQLDHGNIDTHDIMDNMDFAVR